MDLKLIQQAHNKIKELTPEVYNNSLEISVPFFLLHKKIFEQGNQILQQKYNVTQTELDVLGTLYYLGNEDFTLSPTELFGKLLFSSGGMTKILKNLENKQLICRLENPLDKRSKLVQITQEGKDITAQALKEVLSFEEHTFSKLNNKEQKQLQHLLLKVLN